MASCKLFLVLCLSSFALADRRPAPSPPAPPRYGPPPPAPSPPQEPPSYHVPERNCTVDFEKSESEICVPSLQTTCAEEEVTIKAPVDEERCLTIPMVTCKAEVREEELEICVYVYEKKDLEADAKVADVRYTKRCDTDYVEKCETRKVSKPSYGYGKQEEEEEETCKEVPIETCFNKPQAESKDTTVTVTIPQPVKKCEKKKVQIPSVSCEETTEERCFNLISLEETTLPIQKCTTTLAEPRCNKVSLNLPAQTCVEELKRYSGYGRH